MDIDIKHQTQEDIIAGCIRNDADSQKQLYFRYADEMFSTAFRIMGDEHMAADVLHDAFLLIYRDINKLKKHASLRSWIKSIVINVSLKTLQRHKRIKYVDEPLSIDTRMNYDPMDGEHIEKAIMSLPEGYRIVFLLVEVEGYKHAEVAEILGVSEGTSKSQLFYAKQSLRRMLKEA